MSSVDFGRYSKDYAAYRLGPPVSFYQRLDAMIRIRQSRSLDLGTGPGTIALELAARGSSVVGVDTSPEQIATARRVSSKRHLRTDVDFRVAPAEHTGLGANAFDLVTAGRLVEQFCFEHDEEFSHARWCGRMRTCSGVGSGGLSRADVQRFDDALDRLLKRSYTDPVTIQHRLWCVVARKPS